jgi:HTH-type transcriptional regulator/antitoxin HigA
MTTGISDYVELLARVQPRSIISEEDANVIQEQIDHLLDLPARTPAEEALLNLLGDLMIVWETNHVQLPRIAPGALIGALLEERGLPQQALVGPVFTQRSAVSEVIRGRRPLTYRHVQKLAAFFGVSPAVFFPQQQE